MSLGVYLQLFFGLLSVVLLGVKYKSDKRDQYLQHGGWIVKVGLWLGFNVFSFLAPVGLVNAYCTSSKSTQSLQCFGLAS